VVGCAGSTLKIGKHVKLNQFIIFIALVLLGRHDNSTVVPIFVSLISEGLSKNLIPCGDYLVKHEFNLTNKVMFVQAIKM
jgi:hypothetical protein